MNQMVVKWNSCTKFWILSCSSFPIFSRWDGGADFTLFCEVSSNPKKRWVVLKSPSKNSRLSAVQMPTSLNRKWTETIVKTTQGSPYIAKLNENLGQPKDTEMCLYLVAVNIGREGCSFGRWITWVQARNVHCLKNIKKQF